MGEFLDFLEPGSVSLDFFDARLDELADVGVADKVGVVAEGNLFAARVFLEGLESRDDDGGDILAAVTDDGDLLHRLISPKKQVPKVYFARHEGDATEDDVAAFAAGLVLKDGTVCLSAKLEPLGHGESLVTVCEGKYHQVRRMLASRGHFVTYLERRSEGPLSLGDLPRGQARALTESEIQALDGQNPV